MSTLTERFTVHFPADFDDRDVFEMPSRGVFAGVVVELSDGSRYPVTFFDPVRLGQEVAMDFGDGQVCYAEPALVIVPRVTPEAIRQAVQQLVLGHFFDHLKPLDPAAPR